ncbi:hypothetical protein RR46_09932 [Papilio xuthus]|uniref:Uncharacterized protein n=1 Tax=Papilio xuthus TaxID=66420 RepID=A0A194QBC2_PAPXU|nr:hypothetical protein RR46_09932 [Papilio xuthus]
METVDCLHCSAVSVRRYFYLGEVKLEFTFSRGVLWNTTIVNTAIFNH